ncbi:hypothetical protein GCM10027586_13680 [Kineococcus gypseus]
MQDHFDAMGSGGDFTRFLTEDVVWVDTESGERFEGRRAVRRHVDALHGELFEARSVGRSLAVTDAQAFLEGEYVDDEAGTRTPFFLVHDLDGAAISQVRLYLNSTVLRRRARPGA